jgi:hypothetical protein
MSICERKQQLSSPPIAALNPLDYTRDWQFFTLPIPKPPLKRPGKIRASPRLEIQIAVQSLPQGPRVNRTHTIVFQPSLKLRVRKIVEGFQR